MALSVFGENRKALSFGSQKINLHEFTKEFQPKALNSTPGCSDLCFLTPTPMRDFIGNLQSQRVEIVEGPVQKMGTIVHILSVYIRDPDGNLIEIANPLY